LMPLAVEDHFACSLAAVHHTWISIDYLRLMLGVHSIWRDKEPPSDFNYLLAFMRPANLVLISGFLSEVQVLKWIKWNWLVVLLHFYLIIYVFVYKTIIEILVQKQTGSHKTLFPLCCRRLPQGAQLEGQPPGHLPKLLNAVRPRQFPALPRKRRWRRKLLLSWKPASPSKRRLKPDSTFHTRKKSPKCGSGLSFLSS